MTLNRSDETIEIRILSNINNNTNNVWEMVQPYQSGANDDYIDNKILAPIEEISLATRLKMLTAVSVKIRLFNDAR